MARQYWVAPLPPFHTADGTAYTGTAALGDLTPAPPIVIPANMLEAGSRLEIQAFGKYTSTATPGTVTMGLYLGPPATAIGSVGVVCVGPSVAPVASMTNRSFRVEANCSIRTVGAATAATILGCAEITNITGNNAAAPPLMDTQIAPMTGLATLGFDSTVANSIRLGVTPSVTTGSWTCMYMGVRLVN